MISYCIAAYRPVYARLLVDDLIRKTSVRYEVLVWLNVEDAALEGFLEDKRAGGLPVRIVGRSPENIGMVAYRHLFAEASHRLVVQIDDDVICVSRGIAEMASAVFDRCAPVKQLVADVWQDEFTTGARPPMSQYRCLDPRDGLFEGPVDGWFSIYERSLLPQLLSLPYRAYCPIGGAVQRRLKRQRLLGLLCTRLKVFHAVGPEYASLFGMLDFEVEKYRRLGRGDIVEWYERAKATLPPATVLQQRFARISDSLDRYPTSAAGSGARHVASSRRRPGT